MNIITKSPVATLGYDFIPAEYLPAGKDEYHLRNKDNNNGIEYRKLSAYEIEVLVRNRNTSDDWNKILVSDAFTPELVKNCKFYGLIRIGKLEPYYLEFHNLRLPVGLYNSKIISCDLGDNVVVDNVDYISHYIVGNDVIIVNVNELATTGYAKFGNGIIKEGELEKTRIWLEICNENGGRNIIPFDGMLPGDAYLWSRFRQDEILQNRLKEFTEKKFDKQRGYYGKIGDRTVIKNCKIIKDVLIGSDAYLKGANKLKNLTINSSPEAKSQIGEGCEIVNGIIGYGCKIFYGVKAVRFIMASHSQLKYGARLINSYLGNNATISCCEVLNSLIFPAHEQHHNNSFLCAALVMGQSNMAAGATIGSNHNSRSADGEIIAGRGFWPGLCVSLKHNSKFASFIILAKGNYPAELNIPFPFSLVSNDESRDLLTVMPGYWFMYNMYALARNAWKYVDRDARKEKIQLIEYDFLAPDSLNEIVQSLTLIKKFTGIAYFKLIGKLETDEQEIISAGEKLLEEKDLLVNDLEILATGLENSERKVQLVKVLNCYHLFKELVQYYAATQLIRYVESTPGKSPDELLSILPEEPSLEEWMNVGGQLILKKVFHKLVKNIHTGHVNNWDDIHAFYTEQGALYQKQKLFHSMAALSLVTPFDVKTQSREFIKQLLLQSIETQEWIAQSIFDSRLKDYSNPFRSMVYESQEEMNKVIGRLDDNTFIRQQADALESHKRSVHATLKSFGLD
ncbi:MAG TPA: DUF4954 family protein [Chitinophagaceae bacterium]|nr:DUF4954 family protein [Chitinophagaceae bacterium]